MRIQLELSESQIRDLKSLMKETEVDTYKELFNNALTLFQWAVDEIKSGNEIASVNEERERYKVLVMHALERIAKQAKVDQAQLVGAGTSNGRTAHTT
jgi:hypothetical protein